MDNDILERLWNWGRWARIDPSRPDSSCENPFWQLMVVRDDDGYGEISDTTVRIHYVGPPPREHDEIGEDDAETINLWIGQLPTRPRSILIRRFALRHNLDWQQVDPAVRSLLDIMDSNRIVVRKLREMGAR